MKREKEGFGKSGYDFFHTLRGSEWRLYLNEVSISPESTRPGSADKYFLITKDWNYLRGYSNTKLSLLFKPEHFIGMPRTDKGLFYDVSFWFECLNSPCPVQFRMKMGSDEGNDRTFTLNCNAGNVMPVHIHHVFKRSIPNEEEILAIQARVDCMNQETAMLYGKGLLMVRVGPVYEFS